MRLTIIHDHAAWNAALRQFPQAHILQSWEWGEFKRTTTGWQPRRLAFWQGDALVALASVGLRRVGWWNVLYVPKGPMLNYADPALVTAVLAELERFARQQRAIWLKIDPDVILATGVPGDPDDTPDATGQAVQRLLQQRGWHSSREQVQFRNTLRLDLTPSETDLLAAMSQNTRRKVRTGEKKGVTIRTGTLDDLPTLYDLYAITGSRDAFLIRPRDYYLYEWRYLMQAGLAHALIAEVEQRPIAHVILFRFGQTCWYFYGASANEERERMPNYALQWAAIQWAKAQGCTTYDFWGAPTTFSEADSLWGVYEFKRGFRGTVTRTLGAWDYTPSGLLYRSFMEALPRVRGWLRRRLS